MDTDVLPIPGFDDPVSSLTHLLAAVAFAALAVPLLRRSRGHPGRLVCLGVYAFACVFLFAMSGVYHLLPPGAGRAVLARLDHAAIFVLIAGTFTPAHGLAVRGAARWAPLVLLWAFAAAAISIKTVYFDTLSEGLGLSAYLGMGWAGVISGLALWRRCGWRFIRPLAWGGVAYTLGAVLEFLRWPIVVPGVVGPHELFHVAVLFGAGLHWWFVFRLASEPLPVQARAQLR